MTEIADMTATEMLAAFRSKQLSPVEAADACMARILKYNDAVNAFCQLREEDTYAEARAAEKRYQEGKADGLIDGVPLAMKDMLMAEGWPNLKGSKVIDPIPATEDSPTVAALKRHGMVTMGRTTAPEFGWKGVTDCALHGATGNPWDPAKTAGGSSGGSAAAVSLGMAPLATGTDAGGSIRIPAGFSGLVGHKPTHGLAPMYPPSAFYPLAHVGPMTWTVEDTALMMDVICEPDPRDDTLPPNQTDFSQALAGDVRGLKIAFSPTLGYVDIVEPEIAAAVEEAAQAFAKDLGAEVEEMDPSFSDPLESFNTLFYGGAANALRDLSDEQKTQMDPSLVHVAAEAAKLGLLDYFAAANERARLSLKMSLFHQDYPLLLTPALPIAAFEKDREVPAGWPQERWPTWTPFSYPFNLTGQPAISVPCGFTQAGLPVGLQIVGARHNDALVLRAAHLYQQARPLTDRRPDLLNT